MSLPLPFLPSLPPSQLDADITYLEERLASNPEDVYAAACLLNVLDYYTPSKEGLGRFSDCQRRIVSRYHDECWVSELMELSKAAQHFRFWNELLDTMDMDPIILVTQLYAGEIHKIHGEQTNCLSRMALFLKKGAISGFCDSCFKVQILPEDFEGLIKTYFVLRGLKVPRDNTRKCMVELRGDVAYPYKGYIYCESEEEVVRVRELFQRELDAFGVKNVHSGISHGCSEYGLKYPGHKYTADGAHRSFERPRSWDKTEAEFFKGAQLKKEFKENHNKKGITIHDIVGFRAWVKYAEVIGDDSCEKFLGGPAFAMPDHFMAQAEKLARARMSQMIELHDRFAATG